MADELLPDLLLEFEKVQRWLAYRAGRARFVLAGVPALGVVKVCATGFQDGCWGARSCHVSGSGSAL
jgi:hypothetical protein